MAGLRDPFLSMGGTYTLSISTAPTPVQVSTAGVPGMMLSNLSTNALQVLVAQSSLTTMSTLSTAALVPGIVLAAGPARQMTISAPPNAFVSGMTTGTGLTGILTVSPGEGMI